MSLATIMAIAVALSMDAFAVAAACSVRLAPVNRRQMFRLAFHFGLFQALMPTLGWLAGLTIEPYIRAWDHWLAFGLLCGVGLKAIFQACRRTEDEPQQKRDPTRGWSLVLLSVATSLDALAVGLSLSALEVTIYFPAVVIGLVTGSLTLLGMQLGARLGARFGRRVEWLGGLILILIGVKILVEHLG